MESRFSQRLDVALADDDLAYAHLRPGICVDHPSDPDIRGIITIEQNTIMDYILKIIITTDAALLSMASTTSAKGARSNKIANFLPKI